MPDPIVRASPSLSPKHPLFAPGLRRRPRARGEALYWLPPQTDIKKGYPLKSLTFPSSSTEVEIAAFCRRHWAELEAWRKGQTGGTPRYTIRWIINRYQTDAFSPYRKLRPHTKRVYEQMSKIVADTIGNRAVDITAGPKRITGETIRRWHWEWGKPDEHGNATKPARARHVIVHLRVLISYAVEVGVPGAADLRAVLSVMRFPTRPPRNIAPTREQVAAIVSSALEMGWRSVAIVTLAQFELTERRAHILGAWENGQWRPGWLWTGINKECLISYQQTKTGVIARQFDLKMTPALLELIHLTPEVSRIGPVVICEKSGVPWRDRHYADTFRKIARRAGVPDEVLSMDMRAGAATEASSIPAITMLDLQAAGGWSQPSTAARYVRENVRRAQKVVQLRQKNREPG